MTNPLSAQHQLREPCRSCGSSLGYITVVNGQNTVRCDKCFTFLYNAPKTETGEEPRSTRTLHNLSPSLRARVLERANGRCELCAGGVNLHVSHILSVKDGLLHGLTEFELNSEENLLALCEECNLGFGSRSFSPRLYAILLQRKIHNANGATGG